MFLRYVDPVTRTPREYVVRKPIVSIGRASGNDIVLKDQLIAPTHANVLRKPNHLTIAVVDRKNEVYVNGKRVRRADLRPGDKVLIGVFELAVVDGEPEATASAGDLGPEQQAEILSALVRFSERLMDEANSGTLFEELLGAVVEQTRAEKGFIIVFRDGDRHLAAAQNVGEDKLDLSRVSDSIVDTVVKTRKPLIVSNALRDGRFRTAQSVVDLRLSSVMCVPLIYRQNLLGVIYLGNDTVTDLFDAGTLAVLQVFASQASLLVNTALTLNELKSNNKNLRVQLRNASQGDLIGSSGVMKTVFKIMRRLAPTDLTVLVQGETGTGKELVAREIHRLSDRGKKPYISLNCGAIPENLLESELFGHRKGAFTGAVSDKIGKFLAADGGTIFLDEVGEMPRELQVKLLRVLQERVVERVGEFEGRPIDIRIIAATNRDLLEEVGAGRFREDLYYRLNEVTLELPPLRERGDDIVQLAQFFLNRYATQYDSKVRGFSNPGVLALKGFFWPGNVRQLENRIKKAVIMSDRALLAPDDLGLAAGDKKHIKPLAEAEEDFKMDYIKKVLDLNNWNKAQSARDLGVDPRTIFRYIEKMGD
jgi:transcriptional regulator with GAF, ATPase, and Fis domain